jgi:hypothetical protein
MKDDRVLLPRDELRQALSDASRNLTRSAASRNLRAGWFRSLQKSIHHLKPGPNRKNLRFAISRRFHANLLVQNGENILLINPLNFRGDYRSDGEAFSMQETIEFGNFLPSD